MLREFTSFLVEKYESIIVDAGRHLADELVLGSLQSSTTVFLVTTQEFPAIRNAQRYISALMRLGFQADHLKVVVNHYQKRSGANHASLEQIQQTLNQPIFYGIPNSPAVLTAINKGRPFIATAKPRATWTASSVLSSTRPPERSPRLNPSSRRGVMWNRSPDLCLPLYDRSPDCPRRRRERGAALVPAASRLVSTLGLRRENVLARVPTRHARPARSANRKYIRHRGTP